MKQLRLLLDTNIYGFLILSEFKGIAVKLQEEENIVVYGSSVVRGELRAIPKEKSIEDGKVRMLALNLYDAIIGKHSLPLTDLIEFLASEYKREYKGHVASAKMTNDFLIVALASLNKLDIVCSEDNKTMRSIQARRAFEKVNEKNNLRTPTFIGLNQLKELIE